MTVKDFIADIETQGDKEKINLARKALWDKGMPGIPQDNLKDGKRDKIQPHYVMQVLQNEAMSLWTQTMQIGDRSKTLGSTISSARCPWPGWKRTPRPILKGNPSRAEWIMHIVLSALMSPKATTH